MEDRLLMEANSIVRKGLSRKYNETEERLPAVRGRVLVRENIDSTAIGLVCRYSELSYDTPENRILKFSIFSLSAKSRLDQPCRRILRHLEDIPLIEPPRTAFPRPKWNRLNRHYKKAVDISRLLLIGVSSRIELSRKEGVI